MSSESGVPPELLAEERTLWLNRALQDNPQFLDMRERSLAEGQGMSFNHVVHSETMMAQSAINRYDLLELVYQHLEAIGMTQTAEILKKETGLKFQDSEQPWNKTDLQLLISLALGHREDPWNIPPQLNHSYVEEKIEEDNFASPYREDPNTIWEELCDRKLNAVYSDENNPTFANLKRASLKRIIIYLVYPENSFKHMPDADQQLIFLSLHSMTSSDHFFRHLVTLFDGNPDNFKHMEEIRRNIVDTIRKWITFHGLFIGLRTLKSVEQFLTRIVQNESYSNLKVFIQQSLKMIPTLHYGIKLGESSKLEVPEIAEPEILFSPNLSLLMPPPSIVAQQISAYQCKAFSSVHSLEFIIAFSNHSLTIQTPTLQEFFLFGQHIQHLFLNAFVQYIKEEDRNGNNGIKAAFQRMINVAIELENCKNYDALANLLRVILHREEIFKLCNPSEDQKNLLKDLWEKCGKDGEDMAKEDGSLSLYEKNILKLYDSWLSCIPNMTAELKSIRLSITEQPDFINGLINWEKRRKIAERVHILYRFQNQSTFQAPISQIQKVISSNPDKSFEDLIKIVTDRIVDIEDN